VAVDMPGGPLPFRVMVSPSVAEGDVWLMDRRSSISGDRETMVLALDYVRKLAPETE
jgi:hypothetical protein